MADKKYEGISINKLENSEVEITGSVTQEAFSEYTKETLKKAGEEMEISGFRKGKAPESVVLKQVGEDKILNESAQNALRDAYPEILKENKIDAIGTPEVSITKMAENNPLEFKIKTAVSPEVRLSDYKKDAEEALSNESEPDEDFEATEEEVNEVIKNIKQTKSPEDSAQPKEQEEQEEQAENEEKQEETQGNGEGTELTDEKEKNEDKEEDAELTDEFVKTLGNFEGVNDFKEKIKENIKEEKKQRGKEEKRTKILEKIMENSTMELPEVLVQSELEKIIETYKDDIQNRFGYNFEDYLKEIQKTEEQLRENLKPEAEKRAKTQIILNKIAEEEDISVSEEEISQNLEKVLQQYPNADKNAARVFVDTMLTNEKVYQLLEKNNQTPSNE